MNTWEEKLIREQLDKKIKSWKILLTPENRLTPWIKSIRIALGMTLQDLADRMGTDKARISRIEKAEIEGDLRISTLKKVAEALEMEFVYGFLPKDSLEAMVKNQARKIAVSTLSKVNYSMRLEDQELSEEERKKALIDLEQKILMEPPIDFWKK
jgi:predicted DNA-binding mobile mystery protein A